MWNAGNVQKKQKQRRSHPPAGPDSKGRGPNRPTRQDQVSSAAVRLCPCPPAGGISALHASTFRRTQGLGHPVSKCVPQMGLVWGLLEPTVTATSECSCSEVTGPHASLRVTGGGMEWGGESRARAS